MSDNKLAKPLSTLDTSILLNHLSDFPSNGIVKIDSEYILYAFAGDISLLTCTRGFAGSVAATHLVGAKVSLANISDLSDKDTTVKSYLTASGETLDITLPSPFPIDEPQFMAVSHRDGSMGTLIINGSTIDAGGSQNFTWDGYSWSSAGSGGGGSFPLLAPNGSGTNPSYSFTDFPETGLWNDNGSSTVLEGGANEVKMQVNATSTFLSLAPNGTLNLYQGAYGLLMVVGDASTTDNEIALKVFDKTALTLRQVSIGDPDSGGSGYRLLRIPN